MALNLYNICRKCNLNCIQQMCKSFVRFSGHCKNDTQSICGPQEKPTKTKKVPKKQQPKRVKINPFKSMWENPECCVDPCPDVLPRYDQLYYRISDKRKKYQVTWVECPMEKKKVPICCYEEFVVKKPEKRKLRRNKCETVRVCPPTGKCIKITMDGCKKVRNPPKCFIPRKVTDCCKVCTPYPAFSECVAKKSKKPRPVECGCLSLPTKCELFSMMRKGQVDMKKLKFVD